MIHAIHNRQRVELRWKNPLATRLLLIGLPVIAEIILLWQLLS